MKHSSERILTTHTGSLARPKDLLNLMDARLHGEPYDTEAYAQRVHSAVGEIVRQQVASGIDVVTDGEQSKAGFSVYVRERLTGFEPLEGEPGGRGMQWKQEISAFPEYYEQYFG